MTGAALNVLTRERRTHSRFLRLRLHRDVDTNEESVCDKTYLSKLSTVISRFQLFGPYSRPNKHLANESSPIFPRPPRRDTYSWIDDAFFAASE